MGRSDAAVELVPSSLHDHHRDRDLGECLHRQRGAVVRLRGDADSGGEVGSVGAFSNQEDCAMPLTLGHFLLEEFNFIHR